MKQHPQSSSSVSRRSRAEMRLDAMMADILTLDPQLTAVFSPQGPVLPESPEPAPRNGARSTKPHGAALAS